MNDLTTIKNEIQSSISDFNEPFTNYLVNLGLPVEGILAPIEERQIVINSIESEIQKISVENIFFSHWNYLFSDFGIFIHICLNCLCRR